MKRVVVIGGGFAGSLIARRLENLFDVTLIDTKDYFEFTPSVLRTIVEPKHVKKIEVLHTHYLTKTHVLLDEVMDILDDVVVTKKEKVPYDYVVICSGSRYATPIKEEDLVISSRGKELRRYAEKVRQADKVLIIGGGIVGVELAAEICMAYPSKKVILAHSRTELMQRSPDKVKKYATRFLEKNNVDLVFGSRIVKKEGKKCYTKNGTCIEADIAFLCTGIKPNSDFLENSFSLVLDDKGFLKVDDTLRVVGRENIFAAGDITAIREEKTAQNAEKQAEVVVNNIQLMENKGELKKYTSESRPMVISLGKKDGILIKGKKVLTGLVPARLKSLVEWKEMRKLS